VEAGEMGEIEEAFSCSAPPASHAALDWSNLQEIVASHSWGFGHGTKADQSVEETVTTGNILQADLP
jgi:hypothetical protein